MRKNRIMTLFLALLMTAGSFTACSDKDEVAEKAESPQSSVEIEETEEETEPDKLEGLTYNGDEIRMMVSSYGKGGLVSSYFTIVNNEELTGEVVSDAVFERNLKIEDKYNVKFVFTENTENCDQIPATLTKLISAGDDAYDLIIHDMFPLATLSVKNYFANVMNFAYQDYSKDYWYDSFMKNASFSSDTKRYILAGDYFLDILRCAHALYFNKDLFNEMYEDPSVVYETVLNGEWTQDIFLNYIEGAYRDTNGDGTKDAEDIYGYGTYAYWGPMIPWVISSDITFIEFKDDGRPYFAMENERSVKLLERLNEIFYNEGTYDYQGNVFTAFQSGHLLFAGYQRVGSIENYRDMEADIGIIPYPKMDDAQENYITSTHDTASVGVVPITSTKTEMLSAMLEALSRESSEKVLPAYYEVALKNKYVRDGESARMLDIIRQSFSDVFPNVFGSYCNNMPLKQAFSEPLTKKSTDFVSNYQKIVKPAQKKLDELWDAFSAND